MKYFEARGPALVGCATVVTFLVVASQSARAGAPTEQLREHVDQVIKMLQRPELQGDGKTTERRTAVRKIANNIFDFQETAKRSLGRHWQARTPAERDEFTQLFSDLLEHAYIGKIDRYSGENVNYVGESVEGDQATVRTKILTKQGSEVPVDYRLLREGAQWRVYDVVIEGVSLIANYRTQFNKIIQTSSFNDLIAKMKAKEFSTPEGAKSKQG
ncbi:MAG: organic solvent tolerance ABC transporter substrate-binding protein [Candidatus Rokuibacteriota bacterium]|nr:MAG: organic solvent tolerance ABC transporter substrate-binding protein [Candidatus Rokubacteria bacterium]